MTAAIEASLGWLFRNQKGRDAKSFYTNPAFEDHKEQTIEITSPDCGATNATLSRDHMHAGGGRFPTLEWKVPANIATSVKEWLVVCEDPDVPLPFPICHSIFMGIPPEITRVGPEDLEIVDASKGLLKGGFHHGWNLRGVVHVPPRPLINHGPHRYFFQVIALSEPLDKELIKSKPKSAQIAEAIKGNVLGWGLWVGSCERTWTTA